jgi:hypothetical protein
MYWPLQGWRTRHEVLFLTNSPRRGGAQRRRGLVSLPRTPLKSPLIQGGTIFSSNLVPHRGMRGC